LCGGAGEIKKILIDTLNGIIAAHQEARAHVTDDVVHAFMAKRKLVRGCCCCCCRRRRAAAAAAATYIWFAPASH